MTTEPTENLNTEQDRRTVITDELVEKACSVYASDFHSWQEWRKVPIRKTLRDLLTLMSSEFDTRAVAAADAGEAQRLSKELADAQRATTMLAVKLADAEDDLRIGDEHRDELVKRVLALSPGPADPTAPTEPPADRRHPQAMEPVTGTACAAHGWESRPGERLGSATQPSGNGPGRPANGLGVGTDGPGVAGGVEGALGLAAYEAWSAVRYQGCPTELNGWVAWERLGSHGQDGWHRVARTVLAASKPEPGSVAAIKEAVRLVSGCGCQWRKRRDGVPAEWLLDGEATMYGGRPEKFGDALSSLLGWLDENAPGEVVR